MPSPENLGTDECHALEDIWRVMRTCTPQSIHLEIQDECKRKLDVVVSDILGLTQSERDAVYEAVIQLVESRLKKARSV